MITGASLKRTIEVVLGERQQLVGYLFYNQDGARESAAFQYAPEWLASDTRFRIDPALPLVAGPQFQRRVENGSVFPAALADTEPDGWGIRVIMRDHVKRRAAARESGAELPPLASRLDILLQVHDETRLGALRLRDAEGVCQRAGEPGRRTTPPLLELRELLSATRALETNRETAEDLAFLRGRATSLGGLRPKCTIRDTDGSLCIGKFPSVQDERAVTRGEVLALHLAAAAGISAASARLEMSDSVPVALIRRFDREGHDRLHFVSAATLMQALPDEHTERSYTEIVDTIRQFSASVSEDIEELWRRVAFSILITNVDDHLGNHGFLHVERELWRLSPAFDVNPFPDRMRELKTWISEETGPTASIEALRSIAPYCGIRDDRARTILAEVERAVSTWRTLGVSLGMSPQDLDQFADAFEHSEREVARRLGAGLPSAIAHPRHHP